MKPRFLFPSGFRYLGYLLAIPGLVLGYLVLYQGFTFHFLSVQQQAHHDSIFANQRYMNNYTDELALTFTILGLLFIAFSRVKREDELTATIRLNSLYWSILVNYLLYAVVIVILALGDYIQAPVWQVMTKALGGDLEFTVFNFFVPLVIFIGRFNYLLHRNKNEYEVKPLRYLPNKPYRIIGQLVSGVIFLLLLGNEFLGLKFVFSEMLFMFLPLVLLLWVYSREKAEDEYIGTLRLEAMQVAVYVNYAILLISNLTVYGFDYLLVQMLNLVTIPVIFIIWFSYQLYRTNQQTKLNSITS